MGAAGTAGMHTLDTEGFKIYSCGDAGCLLFIDKRRIFYPGIPVGLSVMLANVKIDDLVGFPTALEYPERT